MQYDIGNCIRRIETESIDYIPSNIMLSSINSTLANDSNPQEVIKKLFRQDFFSKYEYIILDCKPSLDLFVVNALAASNLLVIPVQSEKFAYDAVQEIHTSYIKVKETHNPNLKIGGILLTLFTRTNMAASVEELLRDTYGDLVFKTKISRLADATYSTAESKSLISMNSRLGDEYMSVVHELLERI